ncbi:MAG: aminotransferase [Parasphingopyxis sp.]|uniref:aminotransferase n=1 Tax=Parasphingopyxis sp. TaxID=1920299 RepID=UPI003F9FF34F
MTDSVQMDPETLSSIDRRFAFHPFTALGEHMRSGPPMMITSGKGCRLQDDQGRGYIDAMAGLWCVNLGYGREDLAATMKEQAEDLAYWHAFSSMGSDKPALLARRLIELAPAGMSKVFFGNSGSDANDTQIKLVWYYNNVRGLPKKKKIIARERGYHGVTIMTGGVTGLPGLHAGFDLPLPFVKHTTAPRRLWEGQGLSDAEFTARLADDLERLIEREGPDTIGAMIMEPIMGAGGVIDPPEGYYQAIGEILRRHDILIIADEVICAFGRLGAMFGSEMVGLEPDLITVAKGLTSAYFPLSGCIVSEKVWEVLVEGGERYGVFGHGYTYSSHPIGAAVGLRNLELIDEHAMLETVADRGAYLQKRLRAAFSDHPMVGEVRGQALIGAVEYVRAKDPAVAFDPALKVAPRIISAALRRGVISRALPNADTTSFSPPFTISEAEIDEVVAAMRDAVDEVMTELIRAGEFE